MAKAYHKNTRIDLHKEGLQVFNKPILDDWREIARQKKFALIARVEDRYHLALACDQCGGLSKHKLFSLRVCQPQCPHCLEAQWRAEAKSVGFTFLSRDPETRAYAWYRAPCGHEVYRQPHRMRQIAAGYNGFRCETCHAAREAAEAEARGWVLIGPDPEGNPNYRCYEHGCGHRQRVARANMQTGRFDCAGCGECWSAAPSWLYLLRIDLPDYGQVVKLGYSRDPQSRMRYQLGISDSVAVELVTKIAMATGHDAIRAEKRLKRRFPEAVIPSEVIGTHLNVSSEIYALDLDPVIRAELAKIAGASAS